MIKSLAAFLLLFAVPTLTAVPSLAQDFAVVKSGIFVRGADVAEDVFDAGRGADVGPDWDEGPRHEVRLSEFSIATRQVSMEEFSRFDSKYRERLESMGIKFNFDSPAVLVSWKEADEYCAWLSRELEKNVRLPTEAEWEFAASRSDQLKLQGIADGVQEWCHDWWAPYSVDKEVQTNPRGPQTGTVRVLRDGGGGSVEESRVDGETVADYRTTDRSATVPGDRRPNLGFRIAIGEWKQREADNALGVVQGVAFENVSAKEHQWKSGAAKEKPYFFTGGKFINGDELNSRSLPYWNRHHVPSMTWCDNGDLLATAFTAPFDNSDQMAILITRLRTGKDKWDPPSRFFAAPDHNVTAAALFNAGNGEIHHYNGLGNNHCEDFSMIRRVSRDSGATWSDPEIVHRFPAAAATPDNPYRKPRLWPHMDLKAHVVQGKQLLLMSTDVGAGNELGSAIFASDDNGGSWFEVTRTGWQSDNFALDGKSAGWIAGIHAPFEMLADGSLLAIGRSSDINGLSPMSVSSDFGKTWTYSESPFPPILSGQRSVMMRLKEGPLLFMSFTDYAQNVRDGNAKGMVFQDAKGNEKTGFGMFAALSFDEGRTWPQRKLIPNWDKRPWKSRYSGYLSSVQTPDGMIHLVSSRFYYRFNLAWLKQLPE